MAHTIKWDQTSERFYETGVQKCALYVYDPDKTVEGSTVKGGYGNGVAWNGVTAITESPSGAEATPLYADDIKYLNLMSAEEFGGTIEAYTYPDAFKACNGETDLVTGVSIGQQARKTFALCYRTTVGNDTQGNELGYKLHLVYGCLASPSEKAYASINDSPEAITFSWEFTTTPVEVTNMKPTSIVTIDSRNFADETGKAKLAALETKLYGDGTKPGEIPLPDEIKTLMSAS